jgi:hypothetical protein
MSFEFNHNLPPVSLDNYEEYFVLHIDGELNPTQTEALLIWLEQYPHLQEEFRLLQSTKLTPEVFPIDKESLLSHHMPAGSAQEDLLLLMDGELPAEKEKLVRFELSANEAYQQQYMQLLATRLDATELIPHPNKEELYRHERRVVFFRPWMRVAAAVLLMAGSGLWYANQQGADKTIVPATEGTAGVQPPVKKTIDAAPFAGVQNEKVTSTATDAVAAQNLPATKRDKERDNGLPAKKEAAAFSDHRSLAVQSVKPDVQEESATAQTEIAAATTLSVDPQNNINTPQRDARAVLTAASSLDEKNIVTIAALHPSQLPTTGEEPGANEERKGSLKGFFKKAARTIGRKTGLSIEKEDGEVLVGAMALKLK